MYQYAQKNSGYGADIRNMQANKPLPTDIDRSKEI